jgi:uncharacterized protein YkvS
MNKVQITIDHIRNMNSDELNQVVEAIKLQRNWLARTTARALGVGDVVEFTGRAGRTVQGVVSKINQKTVIVREAPRGNLLGTNWKVTASMLKLVQPA